MAATVVSAALSSSHIVSRAFNDSASFKASSLQKLRTQPGACRKECGSRIRPGVALATMRDAQELVRTGVVRPVYSKDVSGLLGAEGYILLDVRPVWEREKAYVAGSMHVPLFVEDEDPGLMTLFKKAIQAGQGGWWMGIRLTKRNEEFASEVEAAAPNGQKLVVACGEGLRSLLAVEELNGAGFENMAWMIGGFMAGSDDDFPEVEGPTKLRFATVGGASEYVLKFAIMIQGLINFVKGVKTADST